MHIGPYEVTRIVVLRGSSMDTILFQIFGGSPSPFPKMTSIASDKTCLSLTMEVMGGYAEEYLKIFFETLPDEVYDITSRKRC